MYGHVLKCIICIKGPPSWCVSPFLNHRITRYICIDLYLVGYCILRNPPRFIDINITIDTVRRSGMCTEHGGTCIHRWNSGSIKWNFRRLNTLCTESLVGVYWTQLKPSLYFAHSKVLNLYVPAHVYESRNYGILCILPDSDRLPPILKLPANFDIAFFFLPVYWVFCLKRVGRKERILISWFRSGVVNIYNLAEKPWSISWSTDLYMSFEVPPGVLLTYFSTEKPRLYNPRKSARGGTDWSYNPKIWSHGCGTMTLE